MRILVIGNGFDLEHELPTKYGDFLDFIEGILRISNKRYVNRKKDFEINLPTNINCKVKEYLIKDEMFDKWEENTIIKELIELSKNNIWIKYFKSDVDFENKSWIDFESEISNVIQCFDYAKNLSEYLKKYNQWPTDRENYKEAIVKKIIEYSGLNIQIFELLDGKLKQIINILNEHLNNLIRSLEIYLEEFINKIDVEFIAPDIKENPCDKILSFNYTDTHHRIYDIYPTNPKEYDYIHGKADINRAIEENNMVLGIDEYLDEESKNKELDFIHFKKYFQRIYKKTGNEYKKWIKQIEDKYKEKLEKESRVSKSEARTDDEILEEVLVNMNKDHKNKTFIFGHSLDVTDKDIIKELLECPNTVTTIFYYDKGVYAQQIANMVKIIGQDELIKRVSGAEPAIIFKQQQKRSDRV
jgi:hypothetical protein